MPRIACPLFLLAATTAAQGFQLDYQPQVSEVVLDTDSTMIQPTVGPPVRVDGGVFVFRNVTISQNVTVRATGSRPLIWIVSGDFTVDGELTVRGGEGQRVDWLHGANNPVLGGAGGPAAGKGGNGSPSRVSQDLTGEPGYGPFQIPGFGGGGGLLSDNAGCGRGSGGGGGSFATLGDPWYPVKAVGTGFWQQIGHGGNGCMGPSGSSTRRLPGGRPGRPYFTDTRNDNDFFGRGADLNRLLLIQGELPVLVGGSGGGGGGDNSVMLNNPNWIHDNVGGSGGGGGGAVAIVALGRIIVGTRGRIVADGGNGGGGEAAGGNTQGGGGGGGSGGMLLLYAQTDIQLQVHGETYANRDYDFVLSADGGIGTQGRYGGTEFLAKYPPPSAGALWDAKPSGGFGGMGLVQLFARPGANADGTNTHLDDNVRLFRGATELVGREKQRYLAWRGFPNAQNVLVDDFGQPTHIGDNEGDIRPTPILLPILP